ncbi:MAG: DNA polymerase I [Christensenellaceae bacterium]|nr:DNA polymerase I [Christensenellaceae bacterium]
MLIILDSNSLLNRAFYGIRLLTTSDGLPTNAIIGYYGMINTLIKTYNPEYMVATFDLSGPTFRNQIYAGYKANRKKMPEELALQLPIMKEVLTNMGIKIIEKQGFEADDIIGTLAQRFSHDKLIVSGDKDSLQLINDNTSVLMPKKGISITTTYTHQVLAEEGLTPAKIIEYKALAGDSADCIVGVPGVGDKTARELLLKYNDIDEIYNSLSFIKESTRAKLINGKESAYLSKKLATIDTNVPIECELKDLKFNKNFFNEKLEKQLLRLQLYSLVKTTPHNAEELVDSEDDDETILSLLEPEPEPTIEVPVKTEAFYPSAATKPKSIVLNSLDELKMVLKLPHSQLALHIFIPTNNKKQKGLVVGSGENKIYFSIDETSAYSISNCFSNCFNILSEGINFSEAITEFKADLESPNVHKIVFDLKTLMHICKNYNIKISPPYDDLLLESYLLNSNETPDTIETLVSSLKINTKKFTPYYFSMNEFFKNKLKNLQMDFLYKYTELPLIDVLFEIENYGFVVDLQVLDCLNQKIGEELDELEKAIHSLAGYVFNINSPIELGDALFNKLKLAHGKKNKNNNYSVAYNILVDLENDHPIISLLLRYKKLFKLKSAYIVGIKELVDPLTKRVHTTFKQCLTTTGRLSSVDPNLQNIPVKSDDGREIRKMFVAPPGSMLLSADYSQIELKLLAHFSGDPVLKKAYANNLDIHAFVASQIFNVPKQEVSNAMRKEAKAVNFGIIYGISAFGLANNIGCSIHEAKRFQTKYFETYPLVKQYIESNVAKARADGFMRTPWGRIRYFKNINAQFAKMRQAEERAAMNMPFQSAAADIIKIAMLKTAEALKKGNFKSRLILQVHDELILEVPNDEIEDVEILVKNCMETAVSLDVPLTVDVSKGGDWFSAL